MNIVVAPSYFGLKQTVTKKNKKHNGNNNKIESEPIEEELVGVSRTDSVSPCDINAV